MDYSFLIKENIINKRKILLNKGEEIGLSEKEIMFILSILEINDSNHISFLKISKETNFSKKQIDSFVASLFEYKLIKIKSIKDKESTVFDFTNLWKKLLDRYFIPNDLIEFDHKIEWIKTKLKIDRELYEVDSELEYMLNEENGWKNIKKVITNFYKNRIYSVEWDNFKEVYIKTKISNKDAQDKIKDILSTDILSN